MFCGDLHSASAQAREPPGAPSPYQEREDQAAQSTHSAEPHRGWLVFSSTWPSSRVCVQLTSQSILQLEMTNVLKSKLLENVKMQAERRQSQRCRAESSLRPLQQSEMLMYKRPEVRADL